MKRKVLNSNQNQTSGFGLTRVGFALGLFISCSFFAGAVFAAPPSGVTQETCSLSPTQINQNQIVRLAAACNGATGPVVKGSPAPASGNVCAPLTATLGTEGYPYPVKYNAVIPQGRPGSHFEKLDVRDNAADCISRIGYDANFFKRQYLAINPTLPAAELNSLAQKKMDSLKVDQNNLVRIMNHGDGSIFFEYMEQVNPYLACFTELRRAQIICEAFKNREYVSTKDISAANQNYLRSLDMGEVEASILKGTGRSLQSLLSIDPAKVGWNPNIKPPEEQKTAAMAAVDQQISSIQNSARVDGAGKAPPPKPGKSDIMASNSKPAPSAGGGGTLPPTTPAGTGPVGAGGVPIVVLPSQQQQIDNNVGTDRERRNLNGDREPASDTVSSLPAIANSNTAPALPTTGGSNSPSPSTVSYTPRVPKPSSIPQATKTAYQQTATLNNAWRTNSTNLPSAVDRASTAYRNLGDQQMQSGNFSGALQAYLTAGNMTAAKSVVRTYANSPSSSRAGESATRIQAASLNLNDSFRSLQNSYVRPAGVPATLPAPLKQQETKTVLDLRVQLDREEKFVRNIRGSAYTTDRMTGVTKLAENPQIRVDSNMIAQVSNLAPSDVVDLASRISPKPLLDHERQLVAKALAVGMDSDAGSPDTETERKYNILTNNGKPGGIPEPQAKMILLLIGGLSSDAKAFQRLQREATEANLAERNTEILNLKSDEAVAMENQRRLREFSVSSDKTPAVTEGLARQILREAEFNPIFGNEPRGSQLEEESASQARVNFVRESVVNRGFPADSVRQVWMLGPQDSGRISQNFSRKSFASFVYSLLVPASIADGKKIRYQTTAAVKTNKGWVVADPVDGEVIPVEEWMHSRAEKHSQDKMAVFEYDQRKTGKVPPRPPPNLTAYDRAHLGLVAPVRNVSSVNSLGDYFSAVNRFLENSAPAKGAKTRSSDLKL